MSEKHRIRDGIIIGVSVLVIWTGAIWIFPSIKAISKSVLALVVGVITEAVSYAFGLLGTPIPLWVVLLGFVLFVVAISTKRRLLRSIDAPQELEGQSTAELIDQVAKESMESKEPEKESIPDHRVLWDSSQMLHAGSLLDQTQERVLKVFGDAGVEELLFDRLKGQAGLGTLKAKQAVERLMGLGFLMYANTDQGELYILSAKGTDYIIEQGWAK